MIAISKIDKNFLIGAFIHKLILSYSHDASSRQASFYTHVPARSAAAFLAADWSLQAILPPDHLQSPQQPPELFQFRLSYRLHGRKICRNTVRIHKRVW